MSRIIEFVGPSALATAGAALDDLHAATGAPVTARRPWLATWADCYPDWEPWLVGVRGDGGLVAAAPLARRRRAGVTAVVALGHGPSDETRLPAYDDAAAGALAEALATRLRRLGAWSLRLAQLPAGDPVVRGLAAIVGLAAVRPGDGMPVVRVGQRRLAGYLSRNGRASVAKARNRLAAAGHVPTYAWTADPAEVRNLLPSVAAVHRARDAALGRRGDHADPRAARFHGEVIGRHADRGEVRLLTLHVDGEVAAYVVGFADGRTLRVWDNRLAPRWSAYSAGRLANTEALRMVVEGGEFDELDWMRGEEPYKMQSATHVVPTSTLVAWSSPMVRLPSRTADIARRSATLRRVVAAVRSRGVGAVVPPPR